MQTVHDALMSDGDTMTAPSGTYEQTAGIIFTKAITLAGLGTVTTNVNRHATSSATKLQCSVSGPVITWYLVANKTSTMTGIEIIKGSANGTTGNIRVVGLNTDNRRMVIERCVFNQLESWALGIDTALGVMRLSTMYCNAGGMFTADAGNWNGTQGGSGMGNGSWADSEHYGSDQFFFFEDNTFVGEICRSSSTVTIAASGTVTFTVPAGLSIPPDPFVVVAMFWDETTGKPDHNFAMYTTVDSYSGTTLVLEPWAAAGVGTAKGYWTISFRMTGSDGQRGERVCMRHNIFANAGWQNHGLEASYTRGGFLLEFYENWMVGNQSSQSPLFFRSGTGLIHDNHITNFQTAVPAFNLVNFSTLQEEAFPFRGPDGRNTWHSNAAQAVVTGTISSATPSSLTARDNTKTWALNQYQNYIVRVTSGIVVSTMTRSGSTVTVNTSTAHGLTTGDKVSIIGADQKSYNGLFSSSPGSSTGCTVVDSDTFTVTLDGPTPTSPATGPIKIRKNGYYGHIVSTATDGTMVWTMGVNLIDYALQLQVGDTYEINLLGYAMDQCGKGAGSLLATPIPENPPAGWPDQVTSPLYQWNNGPALFNTSLQTPGASYSSIRVNEHYFNNVAVPGWGITVTNFTYPHPLVAGGASEGGGVTSVFPAYIIGGGVTFQGGVRIGQ